MKRSCSLSALCCLLACCLATTPALAVQRTMLLETFTNVSCAPCAVNNPIVHQFMLAYGPALAVGIQYHVNWPSATDPFYLRTPVESMGMRAFYGVNGVPSNFSDGLPTASSSRGALDAAAAERLLTDSPFALTVTHSVGGGQVDVSVTVDAVGAVPAGNLRLQVALIETEVHYLTAPGTNREKDFYNTMRRMMPDHNGTTLTITQGEQRVFSFRTATDTIWNSANIRAMAWVQDVNTHEVLQAATSIPRPDVAFYYGTREAADVLPLGFNRTFNSLIFNAGASHDTYDFHITNDLPADWSASVCAGAICYPPWTTDFTLHLDPGVPESILVDVTPLVTVGQGTMTLTATSQADPTKSWTRRFKAISTGFPILCVDADGGHNFETWYHAALDSTYFPYATWDRAAHGKLSTAQLQNFFIVVWNADLSYPGVTPEDRAALGAYLDGGGRLFISGQELGWALCDPTSSDYSAAAVAWYQQYLGASYVMDDTNILSLTGVAGDPIGDGLAFAISGGTGSGLQDYPDEIQPLTGSLPIFTYAANREAGVRYQKGDSKVVYLAYGFQAQATLASRMTVMSRVLDWFDVHQLAVPVLPGAPPHLARAPQAVPNPFHPATKIVFAVEGRGPVPVTVEVYDVLGRRIRTLWDGPAQPGDRALVWDGRDESGAGARAGVYLARVKVGKDQRSLKLFLAR